jgi:hypothetical protein
MHCRSVPLKDDDKVARSTALRYALAGLVTGAIGYAFDLGRFSDLLMFIGGILLSVAFYSEILIDAKGRKKNENEKKD